MVFFLRGVMSPFAHAIFTGTTGLIMGFAARRWIFPESQAQTLLETTREDRFAALYVLALTTGMRQGELLGLRWQDVDLDRAPGSLGQA